MLTYVDKRRLIANLAIAGVVALVLAILGWLLGWTTEKILSAQMGALAAVAFIALFPENEFASKKNFWFWFTATMIVISSLFSAVVS